MTTRYLSRLLALLACLTLIACSSSDEYGGPGGSSPTRPPADTPDFDDPNNGQPVVTPNNLTPTLLKNYYVLETREHDGKKELTPSYRSLTYRPLNKYGWDRFEMPHWYVNRMQKDDETDWNRQEWLHLNFNRDATVVVVWKGDETPDWLSSWQETPSIENGSRSFEKIFKQSETAKLGRGEGKGQYHLLIGEADGSKPVTPELPKGITERPTPNERCPDWVHDQYVATHPVDGRVYRTWHPSIDPVYWCYFEHEHGSDPSLVNYTPYFGHTAAKNNNQNERHEGFKGFAFKEGETNWYINVHATSGLDTRVCSQLHTVVMAATDDSGKLLAELSFKADFGEARANSGDNAIIKNNACPQKPLEDMDTSAEKRVRVLGSGYKDSDYEQWKFIGHEFLGLGVSKDWHHVTFDIRNPITGCDGLSCKSFKLTNPENKEPWANRGDSRTLRFNGSLSLRYSKERDMSDGKEDGYFYTDAKGTKYLDANDENAVRQYVSQTLIIEAEDILGTRDPWRGFYSEGIRHHLPGFKLESSIGLMN